MYSAGVYVRHVTSLIYPDLAFIIYVAYVQSDALFPCLYLSLWSMPLSVPGLIIVTPSSLAYQNPVWLHCNLSLMRLLVWSPAFLDSLILLLSWQNSSIGFLFLHGFTLRLSSLFIKRFWAWLSAISDRPLRSLVHNDLLVPRSRTSTSQQCAFASAGPLLWNCLPVKTHAQILSNSYSSPS